MEVVPLLFCFVSIFLSVTQADLLQISPNIYSGRTNPSWNIPRPVDSVKADQFDKLVILLMKLPKPPKQEFHVGGYDGFVIKHVLDSGEVHSIEVAKCSFPYLETALLETAPRDINPKTLSKATSKKIQETIDSCPRKTKKI